MLLKIAIGPSRFFKGTASPLLSKVAEALVTSTAKENPLALATAMSNRASAGEGWQGEGSGEAVTVVAKLGEQSQSQPGAQTGKRTENRGISMLLKKLSKVALGLSLLSDEAEQLGRQGLAVRLMNENSSGGGLGHGLLKAGILFG